MKIKLAGLLILAVISMQFGLLSSASAAGSGDISMYLDTQYGINGLRLAVCNSGSATSDIESFSVDIDTTNYVIDSAHIFMLDGDLPQNPGSFNLQTGVWTGSAGPNRCVPVYLFGHTVGDNGVVANIRVELLSTTDDSSAVTTYNNDEVVEEFDYTIEPESNLTSEALLLTPGAVGNGDAISYQIDVMNQGPGNFYSSDFFIYAFVMPEGSDFVSVEDLSNSNGDADALIVDNNMCMQQFVLGDLGMQGFVGMEQRKVAFCMLDVSGDGTIPAGNTRYSFKVNLTAGASLAEGDADIVGVVEGNDNDTATLIRDVLTGADVFNSGNDNIAFLQYDPDDLKVTVNRCPGQSATTTNGTGCFRVSFSKKIYADTFDQSDLDLGGVGQVTSFQQLDDFTWEVKVSGIAAGQTLTLKLGANSVQDYFAIMNNVQVLGENTIRFAVADAAGSASGNNSNSAAGTLAETGVHGEEIWLALSLLLVGFLLVRKSRVHI